MMSTRQMLYKIAENIGKNRQQVEPFIKILQSKWYNSQQSLQNLTIIDYERFGIPTRLAEMIVQQIKGKQQPQFPQHPQQQSYQQQQGPNKQPSNQSQQQRYQQPQQGNQQRPGQGYQQQPMYQKQQQPQTTNYNNPKSQFPLRRAIENLKSKSSKQKFNEYIDILTRLFGNIRGNISQQKFKILKKSNKKINELISYSQNCQILKYGGFQENKDLLVLKNLNLGNIDDIISLLTQYNENNKFDPFKSEITNLSGNNLEGESSVIFNEKLKQLEKQRERIMSTPIKDRQIKIFKEMNKQVKPDVNWYDDNDELLSKQDQRLINQSLKQKIIFLENPKFTNKRKGEYEQLKKKPCYSQTLVKVKLPENWVFQCKFSPLQTIGQLVKIFHEHVQNKNLEYHLFMTPPVQKLMGKILKQTFYERGCVPRAIFYFKSDEEIHGNILKPKKSGGLFK